ncbi:MAG: hypothetical protein HYZ42_16405 [Bacteroidetes bacterium]|nr:hypothetical protein [Bacteroidota bacterium]
MDKFDLLIIDIIKTYNEGRGISDPFIDRIYWKKVDNIEEAQKAEFEGNGLFNRLKLLNQKGFIKRIDSGYILTAEGIGLIDNK